MPDLHCLCRRPESYGKMILCDNCDLWCHLKCVGLNGKSKAYLKELHFLCDICVRIQTVEKSLLHKIKNLEERITAYKADDETDRKKSTDIGLITNNKLKELVDENDILRKRIDELLKENENLNDHLKEQQLETDTLKNNVTNLTIQHIDLASDKQVLSDRVKELIEENENLKVYVKKQQLEIDSFKNVTNLTNDRIDLASNELLSDKVEELLVENENLKECCEKQQLEISSLKRRSRLTLSQKKKSEISTP